MYTRNCVWLLHLWQSHMYVYCQIFKTFTQVVFCMGDDHFYQSNFSTGHLYCVIHCKRETWTLFVLFLLNIILCVHGRNDWGQTTTHTQTFPDFCKNAHADLFHLCCVLMHRDNTSYAHACTLCHLTGPREKYTGHKGSALLVLHILSRLTPTEPC